MVIRYQSTKLMWSECSFFTCLLTFHLPAIPNNCQRLVLVLWLKIKPTLFERICNVVFHRPLSLSISHTWTFNVERCFIWMRAHISNLFTLVLSRVRNTTAGIYRILCSVAFISRQFFKMCHLRLHHEYIQHRLQYFTTKRMQSRSWMKKW